MKNSLLRISLLGFALSSVASCNLADNLSLTSKAHAQETEKIEVTGVVCGMASPLIRRAAENLNAKLFSAQTEKEVAGEALVIEAGLNPYERANDFFIRNEDLKSVSAPTIATIEVDGQSRFVFCATVTGLTIKRPN